MAAAPIAPFAPAEAARRWVASLTEQGLGFLVLEIEDPDRDLDWLEWCEGIEPSPEFKRAAVEAACTRWDDICAEEA